VEICVPIHPFSLVATRCYALVVDRLRFGAEKIFASRKEKTVSISEEYSGRRPQDSRNLIELFSAGRNFMMTFAKYPKNQKSFRQITA
jgi:hypothetical protein